jgi:prepilin peptidase CpaA
LWHHLDVALLGAEALWALACVAQDMRQRRIGNRLILVGLGLVLLGLLAGRWPGGGEVLRALVAVLALLLPWRAGILGGGDVKLALVLALLHPAELSLALMIGLAAVLAAGLWRRHLRRRPAGRRLPFAPFLLLPWLALLLHGQAR